MFSTTKLRGRVSLSGDTVHDCTVLELTDKYARMPKLFVPWPPIVHLNIEKRSLHRCQVLSDDGTEVRVAFEY